MLGIRWDIQVIRSVAAGRLNRSLHSFRNSRLPLKDYNRLCALRRNGQSNDATFPVEWERWRSLIERFNLDDELPLKEWLTIADACIKLGWEDPSSLARAGASSFTAFVTHQSLPLLAHQIWKSAAPVFADAPAGATMGLKGASADAESLLLRIKAAT